MKNQEEEINKQKAITLFMLALIYAIIFVIYDARVIDALIAFFSHGEEIQGKKL